MARQRSTWGWGWADRFGDREARAKLVQRVTAVLGGADALELREPAAPRVGAARPVDAAPPFATTDPDVRLRHTWGRSFPDLVRGFRGDFGPAPDVVLRPTSAAGVEASLAWADANGVAVVPFGGGTSVCGGVTAEQRDRPVAALSLRGLRRVAEVDNVSRCARIEAGALGPELEAELAPSGLTLRHYPQSFEFSTLGGWIATRAGGHFATRYTHIDDLVQAISMVTPAGTWASRRLPASGAGPSPDRLVLGSEGALGVITDAWVRLQARPVFRSKATVHFGSFEAAVAAAKAIVQSGLTPSNCRVLDAVEAMMHQVAMGQHVLLLGFESAVHRTAPWLDLALTAARDAGGTLPADPVHTDASARAEDEGGERWRQAFFDGPYLQTNLISAGVVVDTFETACTWSAFEALHADVVASVTAALGGRGLVSCRFTHVYPDGPAPYYTFIAPVGHDAQLDVWRAAKEAASDALIRAGGTITHHHAVGRLHAPWYARQRPEPFAAALRGAKAAVDPSGILNPGVLGL